MTVKELKERLERAVNPDVMAIINTQDDELEVVDTIGYLWDEPFVIETVQD